MVLWKLEGFGHEFKEALGFLCSLCDVVLDYLVQLRICLRPLVWSVQSYEQRGFLAIGVQKGYSVVLSQIRTTLYGPLCG